MASLEFPFHKGARTSFIITGVLLCVLCVTAPVAVWMFWRVGRGRVQLTDEGLEAAGLVTDRITFADVERFGVLRIPVAARGLGGAIATMKLGGLDEGVNLVFRLKNGKDVKFLANQYERHAALVDEVTRRVGVPAETIPMGLMGWKWPTR
jgi:hypothetical protein